MAETTPLAPCPFCGGPVQLEEASPTRDRLYGITASDRRDDL